jgi:hypothetical protein
MAIKSFDEFLTEAAIERGLDPQVVLEVLARAKKLESDAQKEATKETLQKTGNAAKKFGLGIVGAAKGAVKGAAEEARKVDLKRGAKKAEKEETKGPAEEEPKKPSA